MIWADAVKYISGTIEDMRKKIKNLAIMLITLAVVGGCENTKSSDEDEPTDNAPVSSDETDDQEENDDVPEDEPA